MIGTILQIYYRLIRNQILFLQINFHLMKRNLILFGFIILSAWSCNSNCNIPEEVSQLKKEISIDRLEDELFQSTSQHDVYEFLKKYPLLTKEFLGSDQYPDDSVLANILYSRITNPYIDSLRLEATTIFGDMEDIKDQLEDAMSWLHFYYPEAKTPKIQTMVTGFGTSEMYVSDSLIIIGLDYYIGPGASFRPNEYPEYILKRYQKQYIIPAMFLLLADNYVKTDYEDNSMLADMLYYGKKYYFTEKLMPCSPDSLIIWYTEKELKDVNDNQHIIWATFLQNELLFETSHIQKEKFLGERPNTYEISSICPGRIGAWVGWEIVRKYAMDHPDTPLQEILQNENALQLFNESNYKGIAPGLF